MWQRRAMRRTRLTLLLAAAFVALAGAACTDDTASRPEPSATSTIAEPPPPTIDNTVPMTESLHCDPLDQRSCLLPWPNDAFTVPDDTTATGRRLAIRSDSPPANAGGTTIDVTDQNRADGFSPMSTVLTLVPGLDMEQTGVAPSTDIGASLAADAPIVLLDTTAGERLAYWAELDAAAPDGEQLLMVHPAVALPEGHRIIVALRDLRDHDGRLIPPSSAFAAALDGTPEPMARLGDLQRVREGLRRDDIGEDDLFLAWDFTVASADSLAGRALSMRAQAYAALDGAAPTFRVDGTGSADGVQTLDGTFRVPNFLSGDGSPGSTLLLDEQGLPMRNPDHPDYVASFHCVMPAAPAGPVPFVVYGHGLMGNRFEVDALSFAAQIGQMGACATDEIGMSGEDIGNLATILSDLSAFNQQADRMLQGLLNQQFLGLLLNHPDGFAAFPTFLGAVQPGATQFVGNSQGGILGGAASALSSEWDRVVLGVPGIGYSLLLPRSSDWPQFQVIFDDAYTDPVDRMLALQLIQLLWDRGENAAYAQHLTTDPYPGIDAKEVLLVQAFGDHQVANVSTEVLARTIGASVNEPSLAPGRSADTDAQWGILPATFDDDLTALLMVWDFGTPAPPTVNLPPSEPEYGQDPHGAGSEEPAVLTQALVFLLTGQLSDPCGDDPCVSGVLSGAG